MFGFGKSKTNKDVSSPQIETPTLLGRLKASLARARRNLTDSLLALLNSRKTIDAEFLEELEGILISADVGVETTQNIINELTAQVKRSVLREPQALLVALKAKLLAILQQCANNEITPLTPNKPHVILMIGVNGVGKTTTIGKLAKNIQNQGKKVILAAGDTFRAAAVEQLQIWGTRLNVPVISQEQGADSASVIYDALQAAKARGMDVLIADTAGRLHTKTNLMEELAKIARVMKRINPQAPHEVLLVIDASTGHNGLIQALQFHATIPLTGIILTKLDGTAKGGILFAIADRLKIPIRFIGIGEQLEDLRPFNAEEFVAALFES